MILQAELEPGVIVHRRAWRESSLLIEAFTPGYGRVGLVARGARGPRSGYSGSTEPFRPLLMSWQQRGELGTLTGLDPGGRAPDLSGEALWCGFYVNELLLRMIQRHDPAPELYAAYWRALSVLPETARRAAALRRWEMALLQALGVAPELDREAGTGEPVTSGCWYRVDPGAGPRAVAGPGRDAVDGAVLRALAGGDDDEILRQRAALAVTQHLLDPHLGGRPLNTRQWRSP